MFGKKSNVEDIQDVELAKTYSVNGKELKIRIQNGSSGKIRYLKKR